jgi:hypothetical protein
MSVPPTSDSRDHIGVGCALGCAVQIGFAVVGMLVAVAIGQNTWSNIIFLSSAVTQWIGLVPLILHHRAIGRRRTVQGIIIAGCLGMLLCSACGAMLMLPNLYKTQ